MAFILRRASRVFLNAPRQVQGRPVSFNSHYFNVNYHHLCVPQRYNNVNKMQDCRKISNIYNRLLQSETSVTSATSENIEEDQVQSESGKRNRSKVGPHSYFSRVQHRTKSQFLSHFHHQLSKGQVFSAKRAYAMIKSCGKSMVGETYSTKNELLTYVWSELESNGVPLDTALWNTLLSVYIENRHHFEPSDILKSMEQKSNSQPNKSTFNLLTHAYAVKGDPVGAIKMFEMIVKNGGAIREDVYGFLIQAFAKSGNMSGVDEVFNSMRENNLQPSHTTYGNLITAYAERGDLESINDTIQEMIRNDVHPTSQTCINLLDHLSLGGHTDLIEQVWTKIEDIGYVTEDINNLIDLCVGRGDYKAAFILLRRSTVLNVKRKSHYYIPEIRIFEKLQFYEKDVNEYVAASSVIEDSLNHARFSHIVNIIRFLVGKNKDDFAIKLLESLLAEKKPVKAYMFHPILKNYAEKELVNEVLQVYELMLHHGIPLDYLCFQVMSELGEPTSKEFQLFLEIIKNNDEINLPKGFLSKIFESDDTTLNEVTNVICSASNADLFSSLKEIQNKIISNFNADNGIEIVSLLHKRGMKKKNHEWFIEDVIAHLVTSKDSSAEEALAFMKGLLEKNIPMKSISYTKILRMLYQHDMTDEFFNIVRLMKSNGTDPDVHQYFQMLKLAAKIGKSEAAQYCVEQIIQDDFFDKKFVYLLLITAYRNEKVHVPTEVFQLYDMYSKRKPTVE